MQKQFWALHLFEEKGASNKKLRLCYSLSPVDRLYVHMLARSIYSKTQFHCRTNGILDAAVSHVPGIRIESVDRISNLGRGNINPFVVVVFFLPKLGLRLPQKSLSSPPCLFCRLPWGFCFLPLSSIVWLSFSVFVSQGKCCKNKNSHSSSFFSETFLCI